MPRFTLIVYVRPPSVISRQAVGRVRHERDRAARSSRSGTADRRCRGRRRPSTCRRSPADRSPFRRPGTRRAASCACRRRRRGRTTQRQRPPRASVRARSERATPRARISRRACVAARKRCEPRDAVVEARVARGEAPADEAFAFRTERAARREAELAPRATSRRQKRDAVAHAVDAEERVHRARAAARPRRPAAARSASTSRSRARRSRSRVAPTVASPSRERDDARPLHEHRRARRVVFDQLAEVGHQRGGRDDPAEAPAGHQPRLREAVRADHALVAVGEVEKRRRAPRVVVVSRAARRRRRRRSRCRAARNARRARAADAPSIVQPVGLFGELIISARVPGVSARAAGRGRASTRRRRSAAARRRRRADRIFGISTRFGHSGVTTTTRSPGDDQRLDGEHQRRHAGRRDGDVVRRTVAAVQRASRSGDRVAQLRDAEVLRVERLAARERRRPRRRE